MAMGSAWEDDFVMSPTQEYRHWEDYRRLKAENAKLRELVQEAVDAASLNDMRDWRYGKRLAFLREARELGIEVQE